MHKAQSKVQPTIKRLRGKIIYPVDVQEIVIDNEDNSTEIHYSFYPVELEDKGDDIQSSNFTQRRYADLRRLAPMPLGYGSQDEQLEMQQEQGLDAWVAHCLNVKNNWPKA